jgi:uncharacterized protein CbrC (UPF0167 family)
MPGENTPSGERPRTVASPTSASAARAYENLPTFRFFPSAFAAGRFSRTDELCSGCAKARGWLYEGVVYATDLDDAKFCPWCIAGGRVAALGGTFNDLERPADGQLEVEACTPGFDSWQDQQWPVHHDLPCTFVAVVGFDDLRHLGDAAVLAMKTEVRSWGGWTDEAISAFVGRLTVSGQPTGYIWRCENCGAYTCRADFS